MSQETSVGRRSKLTLTSNTGLGPGVVFTKAPILGVRYPGLENKSVNVYQWQKWPLKSTNLDPYTVSLKIWIPFLSYLDLNPIMISGPYVKRHIFTLPCSLPIKWPDGEVDILDIHILKDINSFTTIKFNWKLAKIDKILQPWRGIPVYLWTNHID